VLRVKTFQAAHHRPQHLRHDARVFDDQRRAQQRVAELLHGLHGFVPGRLGGDRNSGPQDRARDDSARIRVGQVASPAQSDWLNHYPSTSHTIYIEDFEAKITVAGGSRVVVGATDGDDRQIDNAEQGPADRRKLIAGVTDEVLDGQMLRLDVIDVAVK
jgi:hypothetical protein